VAVLGGDRFADAAARLYDRSPNRWDPEASRGTRIGVALRVLTRLRLLTRRGEIEGSYAGPPDERPSGTVPWYEHPGRGKDEATVLFGHWSALGFFRGPRAVCLDSGVAWGRRLTALRVDDGVAFHQPRTDE
jgi:bis(5'-nucleosyl)-tetraphosphatase (symmetrical)